MVNHQQRLLKRYLFVVDDSAALPFPTIPSIIQYPKGVKDKPASLEKEAISHYEKQHKNFCSLESHTSNGNKFQV